MRDRLIELIEEAVYNCKIRTICHGCKEYGKGAHCVSHAIADHLLANGVIVPPCKVGDTVWIMNKTAGKVFYNTVVCVKIQGESRLKNTIEVEYRNVNGETSRRKFTWAQFGRQVFYSREEAERALKEGEHHD